MFIEILIAIIFANFIHTIYNHIRVGGIEADLKDLRLKTGSEFLKMGREAKEGLAQPHSFIDKFCVKDIPKTGFEITKDAKTGAEIVHKVLENGDKELIQVKNAAYLDWEKLKELISEFYLASEGTGKSVQVRLYNAYNDAKNEVMNKANKVSTSARDEWKAICKDIDGDVEAVKRGVVKELSEADAAIVEGIAKEDKI